MHRRSFLKTTVVGAGAVGASGCAHLDLDLGSMLSATSADVVGMVNQLRARLDSIASPATHDALVAARPQDPHDDHLFQHGAQTLVLAGAFHSMPEDVRAHPAVQQLMGEKLAMMSSTALQLHQVALATTPEERRELTKQLKEDPALLDDAAQRLDTEASRLGISGEMRLRLRGLFVQVGGRMKQSASLAIEEYSHKVARIEARMAEPRGFEREYIARYGEQAFWDFQSRQDGYALAWATQPNAPLPTSDPSSSDPPSESRGQAGPARDPARIAPRRETGDGSVAIPLGASMLGLGLALGIGSIVAFTIPGSSIVGAFIATPAVLLFIAGCITLAVGSGRAERARARSRR